MMARAILALWLLAAVSAAAAAAEGDAAPPLLDALLAAAPGEDVAGAFGEERRQSAMRSAALAYGSRGGLARRGWEIARVVDAHAGEIGRIFRFEALVLREAGFVLVPPEIVETRDSFRIAGDAAVRAARVLRIAAPARVAAAAPRWRDWLARSWPPAAPPVAVLWPRDDAERALWRGWVAEGWERGRALADEVFAADVTRLVSAWEAMTRWHGLHLAGMVSAPRLAVLPPTVAGGGDVMRIAETSARLTDPAALNPAARLWLPLVVVGAE